MTQADDDAKARAVVKDQIEHAKFLVDRNKEIYKDAYESNKTIESKISRLLTLVTFMFTLNTALISIFLVKTDFLLIKIILTVVTLFTYYYLIRALESIVATTSPTPREGLMVSITDNINQFKNFSDDLTHTLKVIGDFSASLIKTTDSLSNRNNNNARHISNSLEYIKKSYYSIAAFVFLAILTSFWPFIKLLICTP